MSDQPFATPDGSNINQPTGTLLQTLFLYIVQRGWHEDEQVKTAYQEFWRTAAIAPVIVDYIKQKTEDTSPEGGFTNKQLELMMFGMIARSSSTYGTIPGVTAHLEFIGQHHAGSVIADNLKDEVGNKQQTPHATLLYESFEVLGQALGLKYPNEASYHLTRIILLARPTQRSSILRNSAAVEKYIEKNNLLLPEHTTEDVETALYFAKLIEPSEIGYHTQILEVESRMSDARNLSGTRNPYDRTWAAIRALELAMREASSVDEFGQDGILSFIGSWGRITQRYIAHVPEALHAKLNRWMKVHNDDETGQEQGRERAAERDHAQDACDEAMKILEKLPAKELATVLRQIAQLNEARLVFWQHVVASSMALEYLDERGQPFPREVYERG